MIVYLFLSIGIAGILIELTAFVCWVCSTPRETQSSTRRMMWGLSAALALSSPLMGYFYSPTQWISGVPFPAAAFELSNGTWLDFVGPLTLPMYLLNVVVCLFLFPAVSGLWKRIVPQNDSARLWDAV